MKKIAVTVVLICTLAVNLRAEEKSAGKAKEIAFYNWGIFGELSQSKNADQANNGAYKKGGGGFARFGSDYNFQSKKFRAGWLLGGVVGYGYKPSYIPYVLDLGFTGAYKVYKGHEIGATYSFLGLYAFSNYGFFGSQFSLLCRYRFIQLEYARDGNGAIKGCFTTYQNVPGIHQFSTTFFIKDVSLGARYLTSPSGGGRVERCAEYRLMVGLNF